MTQHDLLATADLFGPYILGGALVVLRLAAATLAFPSLGPTTLPGPVRTLAVLTLGVGLDLALGGVRVPVPDAAWVLAAMAAREVLLGAGLGLAVALIFAAVRAAGSIASLSMALSMSQMVDPGTGEMEVSLGTLLGLCTALVFFALGGHHVALQGLHLHLQALPVGVPSPGTGPTLAAIAQAGTGLGIAALVLAAPVVASGFVVNVSLALVSRVVPSANLFAIGLGLLILAGLASLGLEGDAVVQHVTEALQRLPDQMGALAPP